MNFSTKFDCLQLKNEFHNSSITTSNQIEIKNSFQVLFNKKHNKQIEEKGYSFHILIYTQ